MKPFYFKQHGQVYSIRKIPDPPATKLEDKKNRAKAIVKYFSDLFLGNPNERIKFKQVFDPTFAERLSKIFQAKHGQFGENLVSLLGNGPSHEELVKNGVIDH